MDRTKVMLTWVEPMDSIGTPTWCYMYKSDVLIFMKNKDYRYEYLPEEDILLDFMAIYWAQEVDEPFKETT